MRQETKNISYDELKKMDLTDLFIRYSSGVEFTRPKTEQGSRDHGTGQSHSGLSANNLHSDWVTLETQLTEYIFCLQGNNKAWVVRGKEIGRDTDNAPLIEVDEVLGHVPYKELKKAEAADKEKCTHANFMNYGKGLECVKCGVLKDETREQQKRRN